jgi:hypothetical protein
MHERHSDGTQPAKPNNGVQPKVADKEEGVVRVEKVKEREREVP